jgi:hypothetical protein
MKRFIPELICILACLGMMASCSSTLKATKLNDSGYYPTSWKIREDDIKVQEPFDTKYCSLLVVMTEEYFEQLDEFFVQSFVNMEVFDVVLNKEGVESLVFDKGLAGDVTSVSDMIGLYNLQTHIGCFLVVDPAVTFEGGFDYSAELRAIDPETGKVVFHVKHKTANWSGLDKPLFYPLFNAFIDWTQNRPISTYEKQA